MKFNSNALSKNFSNRADIIKYIIIHYTEMSFDGALKRLCDPKSNVSAHYLIRDDGEIMQLVGDKYKAWHAGKSFWKNDSDINNSSIGIELDNLGNNNFSKNQIIKLIELCRFLMKKYDIPKENVIGHSDIAPNRKIDPGILFPWNELANYDIGIWSDEISNDPINNEILYKFGDERENIKEMQYNLSRLGYNIQITGQFDIETNYVVRAFQSHFNQEEIKKRGIEFYQSTESKYCWDRYSDLLLKNLINKMK